MSFLSNLSQQTRDYLNSLPFKAWDRFHTPEFNLNVTPYTDLDNPKTLIFREFESRHEIRFTINDANVVHMSMYRALRSYENLKKNIWAPFADKLLRLISEHDIKQPIVVDAVETVEDKTAMLMSMDYLDLYKLYRTSQTLNRRNMKKDRVSLVRRLSKIL